MNRLIKIPKGTFFYGVTGNNQNVLEFYMGDCTVTAELWNKTAALAAEKGYDICLATGEKDLPAGNITWFDAVKFCNALSELMGRKCVYYTDSEKKEIYRRGETDIDADCVDGNADGFRLPAEMEWEYACKAGTVTRYYWGDSFNSEYAYPSFAAADNVIPKKAETLIPNDFGLYNMSGNVYEWCFDRFKKFRIMRGGSVALDSECRSEMRNYCYPDYHLYETGVRIVSSKACESFSEILEKNPDLSMLEPSFCGHSPIYTDKEFGKLLDLEKEDLSECKKYFILGDYEKCTKLYRNKFVKSIKEQNKIKKIQWPIKLPPAEDIEELMNCEKDDIIWFASEKNQDVVTRRMSYHSLYLMWEKTGEIRYFKKWIEFVNHKALHYKEQFDSLPYSAYALVSSYGPPQAWECFMGFNDKGAEILRYINNAVLKLSDAECEKYITADLIKNVLMFCRLFNIEAVIKDSRSTVSNQMIFTDKLLIEFSEVMKDFKDSDLWFELALERIFGEWLGKSFLADGSDLEQAYNYNFSAVRDFAEIAELIGDNDKKSSEKLLEYAKCRQRMLAAVVKPFGGQPATGTMHDVYPPLLTGKNRLWAKENINAMIEDNINTNRDGITEEILKSFAEEGNVLFNSIAFPYGGYYVLRENKKYDSLYLWHIAARRGMGHCNENANSISVAAYGRNFLISCGGESYRHPDFVAADQKGYIEKIDDYQRHSYSWNTVIVDGLSQKRYSDGKIETSGAYKTPIKARFHISDNIELTEGFYNDGYGNDKITVNAEHIRRIYFIKPLRLWICEDEMISDEPHSYTQIWNFPAVITHEFSQSNHKNIQHFNSCEFYNYDIAGFYDDEIKIDKNGKMIYTVQNNAPNLFMYHLTNEELSYERFFGSLSPAAGWQSPGIKGRRFPKTDVHVTWKSTSLITLIAPSENEQSPIADIHIKDNVSYIETKNGNLVFSKNGYTSEKLCIKADTVVLYNDTGMVLGCREFIYMGNQINKAGDFEFKLNPDYADIIPVKYPEGFKWIEDEKGIDVSYSK